MPLQPNHIGYAINTQTLSLGPDHGFRRGAGVLVERDFPFPGMTRISAADGGEVQADGEQVLVLSNEQADFALTYDLKTPCEQDNQGYRDFRIAEANGQPWMHHFKVHDHGFIKVVDYMGNDQRIIDAARMSYGRGTKRVNEDRGLIRYLRRHDHTTPFEMNEIIYHVKMPIFVARQWIRHRTASVNEYSARYSILDSEFYIPSVADLAPQSKSNRQGREGEMTESQARDVRALLLQDAMVNYNHYTALLNDSSVPYTDRSDDLASFPALLEPEYPGLARELARMNLTLNSYTQWYWKIDLHNLFNFLRLRCDPHAQKEIRVYADIMLGIVRNWCPLATEAFEDYVLHAHRFSRQEMEFLRLLLKGSRIGRPEGLSKREYEEFAQALGATTGGPSD